MLTIKNLHAQVEGKKILKGINLEVKAGEVHAIMGPNGSGKSTLASVLAGRADYEVTDGTVELMGKNLLELSPEERAGEAVFLAFQYPVEIPGLTTTNFIKTAVNEVRKYRGLEPFDAVQFLKLMKEKMALMEMDLRKPKLSKLMNVSRDPGISNYVVGNATLPEIIRETHIPNLFIIPAGAIPPNPTELIGRARFGIWVSRMISGNVALPTT